MVIFIGLVVVAAHFVSYADVSPASDQREGMKAVAARGCSDYACGTLRMHAPKALFFRMNGECRRFRATVGFDPAIHSLKRKYGPEHVAATKMGLRCMPIGSLLRILG